MKGTRERREQRRMRVGSSACLPYDRHATPEHEKGALHEDSTTGAVDIVSQVHADHGLLCVTEDTGSAVHPLPLAIYLFALLVQPPHFTTQPRVQP
jgi:hypothetical protein